MGTSDITLTCNVTAFKNVRADAKYFTFCKNVMMLNIEEHLHMSIKIKTCTFFDCLNAITEIINYYLNCNVSLPICYIDEKDAKIYECQLSAIAMIPLYIVKYFVKKQARENNVMERSLF